MNINLGKISMRSRIIRSIIVLLFSLYALTRPADGIVLYDMEPVAISDISSRDIDVNSFTMLPSLGTVKYVYKGNSDKVVFHIQDAHCNYDAQKKIFDIIDTLNQEFKVRELNLEGGAGEYDLSVFTDMPDPAIRKRVADYFVGRGEVSGPEFFALMNPEKVKLWGIENIDLYLKNLGIYRDSLGYTEHAGLLINNIRHYLSNLKVRIFNADLLKMDSKFAAYKAKNIEFKDYLEYLIQTSKNNAVDLKKYPNLFLLSHVIDEEKLVDFKKANTQREELIKYLQQRISNNDMRILAEKTGLLKNKQINECDFYEYLLQLLKRYGTDIKDYPKLHQYIIYVSMYGKVDRTVIMDEMENLENVIKEGFYENEKQRELDSLSRNLVLMRTLFDLSFTVRDYEYYARNRDWFNTNTFLSFIKKYAPRYKIKPVFDPDIGELDGYRERLTKFYEYSFERDRAFIENLKLSGNGIKSGIVVTGGFHTENLLSLLREQDVSYVSIMPAFINEKGYTSPYFDILAGKEINEFDEQIKSVFFSIQVPSIMNITNRLANNDPMREEIFRIEALALETMLSSEQKPKVIIANERAGEDKVEDKDSKSQKNARTIIDKLKLNYRKNKLAYKSVTLSAHLLAVLGVAVLLGYFVVIPFTPIICTSLNIPVWAAVSSSLSTFSGVVVLLGLWIKDFIKEPLTPNKYGDYTIYDFEKNGVLTFHLVRNMRKMQKNPLKANAEIKDAIKYVIEEKIKGNPLFADIKGIEFQSYLLGEVNSKGEHDLNPYGKRLRKSIQKENVNNLSPEKVEETDHRFIKWLDRESIGARFYMLRNIVIHPAGTIKALRDGTFYSKFLKKYQVIAGISIDLSDLSAEKPRMDSGGDAATRQKYIVFDIKKGKPTVSKYSEAEFRERYQDKDDYNVVAENFDLTAASAIWALSRAAEENIKELPDSEGLSSEKVIDEFRKRTAGLNSNISEALEAVLQKGGIHVKQGLFTVEDDGTELVPIAVSSSEAIYLPDVSLDEAVNKLAHELTGGTFNGKAGEFATGHELALAVEKCVSRNDIAGANAILDNAGLYTDGKNLWTMSETEVMSAQGMDFAAFGGFFNRDPAVKIGDYLENPAISSHLKKNHFEGSLKSIEERVKEVSSRISKVTGAQEAKKIVLTLLEKTAAFDRGDKWLEALTSFLDNIEEYIDSDAEKYTDVLNDILAVSDSSTALEGFGEILERLLRGGYTMDQIFTLFKNDLNPAISARIKVPWNRLVKTFNNDPRKYMKISQNPEGTYKKAVNRKILNAIASDKYFRFRFQSEINNGQLEYLETVINSYNSNRSNIKDTRDFLKNYFEKSEGNDMLGIMVGDEFIADPVASQIGVLDSKAIKQAALSKTTVNNKPIVVKRIKENQLKDIFGKKYVLESEEDKDFSPDSFILRGYDQGYTIILIDKGDRELQQKALNAAGKKIMSVNSLIESLRTLNTDTPISQIIPDSQVIWDLAEIEKIDKDTSLNDKQKREKIKKLREQHKKEIHKTHKQKIETIRTFIQLSSRYLNRNEFFRTEKNKTVRVTPRDRQLLTYTMIYTLFFNWIIPEDDILPEIGREEFKTKSIAEIFMDLIEKKPHLFNGDSWSPTKITIPMPIEWNFIKNNFDMVFQRLRTNIYQDAPVSWPTGNNPNEINSTGNSAIGNIKLENGQTVTNFDKQLEMKVDLANGKIDVSGQTEKLKNGDIHLDVDTAPLTDEEKNDFIAELNRLIADDDPLTKNTLTDTEKLKIKPLIENLKTADIYLFTGNNQESLFGFSHNGNLFLDESMLLSPLSFIHEMGESEIPLPPGFGELNRHTFLRGVGSKTREALIAIIAEGDTDLLRKMRDSSENFINEINTKRKTMGLGNIPAPEEALIRYNFATINNGERYPEMVESIGLEIFLFGLQDHMDPVMNAEFTAWIKTLTNSLNRGVHDIIVLRETDLMAQGLMGRLKRQARKGMLNIGRDLTIIVQKDGEELIVQKDGEEPSGTLVRAYAYADDVLTRESGKLPKIFLDLAYPASDNEILQTVSSDIRAFVENRNRADMTVIIDELIPNVPEGEAPRIDLGKLIVVASGLLDDKRRAKDFKMSARDMYENRKAMISAFQKSGILTLTDEYDAETAKGLEKILNDIGAGILRMRITRINWEEIADWFEANIEVMRSL